MRQHVTVSGKVVDGDDIIISVEDQEKEVKRLEIADIILNSDMVNISYGDLETAIAGETAIVKKLALVVWAKLQ